MNRNHTRFWFVLLGMLLAPWAIQGLKAQDFQYVPAPPEASRWPPTPKPYATMDWPLGPPPRRSAQNLKREPTVIVRAVHGTVQYSKADQWPAVKKNMQLGPGTTLRTGADSYADVWVNGISVVRVTAETTLQFQKMTRTSTERNADTETILNLKSGTIFGNVKKLSANSRYEIITPHGVAGMRGTDFQVSVVPQANGVPVVTFTSVCGEVVCAAMVKGTTVVKVLRFGECWTPGEDLMLAPPTVLIGIASSINALPIPPPNW